MKIKFKIGFFAILMLITVALTSGKYFSALICSVAIHEFGHIFMAKIRKINLAELKLGIFGASLTPSNTLFSYSDEIILCLGGPLFNYISVFIWVNVLQLSPTSFFVLSSIALGTMNLLPIINFDGGRITTAILCIFISSEKATAIVKIMSFIFIFSLWCLSLYILMRSSASLTIFVFSVSMFVKIFMPDVL